MVNSEETKIFTVGWIIEFYPEAIMDVIMLFSLIRRRKNIKTTNQSFNTGFPYTIKVKMLFILIWLFFCLLQAIFVLVSTDDNPFWLV